MLAQQFHSVSKIHLPGFNHYRTCAWKHSSIICQPLHKIPI